MEIGCGGTLARHVEAGDEVIVVHLSSGVGARTFPEPDQEGKTERLRRAKLAATELGVKAHFGDFADQRFDATPLLVFVKTLEQFGRPNLVYTHFAGDLNKDHRITSEAVRTAFRPRQDSSVDVLEFEIPGTTELGGQCFNPQMFVDVLGAPWHRKIQALRVYGETEIPEEDSPRSIESVDTLSRRRGLEVGLNRAEAFVVIRKTVR